MKTVCSQIELLLYTQPVFLGLQLDGICKITRQELMKPYVGADIERMSLEDGEMKWNEASKEGARQLIN